MAKQEKRQQKRTAFTLQCIEGQDDDLIGWLSRLPSGARQSTVKNLLRKALKLRNKKEQEEADRQNQSDQWQDWAQGQIVALQDEVLRLRDELARRPSMGINAPIIEDDSERLAQEEIERRANRIDKAAW